MKARTSAVLVALAPCPLPRPAEEFEGTLLSGTCTDVGTRLVLQPNGVYSMSQTDLGTRSGDVTLTRTGRWHQDGTLLRLVPHTSGTIQRFVRLPNGDLRIADSRHPDMATPVLRRLIIGDP